MKNIIPIILIVILCSCLNQDKNPSGLNPENMTEEELYMYYGLEAPPDVYSFIYEQIKNINEFNMICTEKTVSQFIRIDISTTNMKITEVRTEFSDYSDKLDSIIQNALKGKELNFSFIEGEVGYYDFRLDIEKLCKGKDFSTTPPKDSTLKTQPILNKTLKNNRELLNDTAKYMNE